MPRLQLRERAPSRPGRRIRPGSPADHTPGPLAATPDSHSYRGSNISFRMGAFPWERAPLEHARQGQPRAPGPVGNTGPGSPARHPGPAPGPGLQPSQCHNDPVITVSMPHCDGSRPGRRCRCRPPHPGTPGTRGPPGPGGPSPPGCTHSKDTHVKVMSLRAAETDVLRTTRRGRSLASDRSLSLLMISRLQLRESGGWARTRDRRIIRNMAWCIVRTTCRDIRLRLVVIIHVDWIG